MCHFNYGIQIVSDYEEDEEYLENQTDGIDNGNNLTPPSHMFLSQQPEQQQQQCNFTSIFLLKHISLYLYFLFVIIIFRDIFLDSAPASQLTQQQTSIPRRPVRHHDLSGNTI